MITCFSRGTLATVRRLLHQQAGNPCHPEMWGSSKIQSGRQLVHVTVWKPGARTHVSVDATAADSLVRKVAS